MTTPVRFTDIAIRNLKPTTVRREIPDPGAAGLYLIIHPSGRKSFALRYRFAGAPRKLTLQAGVSLAVARKLVADAMHELASGHDPGETRKIAKAKTAAAAINTFQFVAEEYFKREHSKLRTAIAREALLRRLVFPAFGSRPIATIQRGEIVRLLDRIEDTNGARSADLALQYLRRIMNWYALRDDGFRSPIIKGMGRYSGAANARSRTLNDDELRTVWKAAGDAGYFGNLVKFLLLTACRRGEGAGLRWSEIEDGVWNLPASRHKTNTPLARPLSRAALALIQAQPCLGDYVFSSSGERPANFGRAKREFFTKCGVNGWRLHDTRRTARTLLSRSGVDADIAERCLGHSRGIIRGIYDRHDFRPEMQHAFEALAAQIERIINPPAGDVVPMRRTR
jgi:integrase